MPKIEVTNGHQVEIHYEDSGGDDPPVVLIHGWPLSGESWEKQLGPLKDAGQRVVTYDRRGFGRSSKPESGYDYDTLAGDLHALIETLDLSDVVLVGFSMGGGEVARYVSRMGDERVRGVVFAAAVPPFLRKTDDNPEGPLDDAAIAEMEEGCRTDRKGFFDKFMTMFFSVEGELKVSEEERQKGLALADQAGDEAAIQCIGSFARTDFREDLAAIRVPTLVIHGRGDATVPYDASGKRTHEAIDGSRLVVLEDGPHGINASHPDAFNEAVVTFVQEQARSPVR